MNSAIEARIHEIAERQHGVITRAQLLEAGLTPRMIWRRLKSRRLRLLHRGVYLVGPLVAPRACDLAAVLACGATAVLSHWNAAALFDLALLRQATAMRGRGVPRRPAAPGRGRPGDPARSQGRSPLLESASRPRQATLSEVATSAGRAAVRRLVPPPARVAAGLVDVTVPGRDCSARPGIRCHRVSRLHAGEVTVVDGIPVTTPARTILDLTGELPPPDRLRALEQLVALAERRGLTTQAEILQLLERHPRRRGVGALRAVLAAGAEPALTRSELEEIFLLLVRSGRLPAPVVNGVAAGLEVDFHWPVERVVAELDGFAFHSSRQRFENDRDRDAMLEAAGFTVIRVTWRQLTHDPNAVLGPLAFILGRAGRQLHS